MLVRVIADQLPEFRHATAPGEADESALLTSAPGLSVSVQGTPAGVGAPTLGAPTLVPPEPPEPEVGEASVPLVVVVPPAGEVAWPVA